MNSIKQAFMNTKDIKHPIHEMIEMINSTPMDMIRLKYEQKDDGSKEFHFSIPSRAEQAKQKAMQQAVQRGQPMVKSPGTVDEIVDVPESMNQPAMASSKVEIKVAMTDKEFLRDNYPGSFLKAMDLA